ncbi:hypothetical protein GQ602_001712 [Ophiocordyceps camponoti-floridani]|uniref:DUF8035 domain-containing protein n=1 Tax=Ophiocordyceps camponoti-floridani TaxID=2030778 RepID=A0A8H4Q928_9HYPO|nr:hypothetical protein GQ602_001712 [Ophiocordyceps camponoti-floridani]
MALRHLRIEASDEDSPLAHQSSRLQPLVRDCETSLKLLEALLDRCHGDSASCSDARVAAVLMRLDSDTAAVDMLLDSVQLPAVVAVETPGPELERIKDKVDGISATLFARRSAADDEHQLWLDFKVELEREGFAPQVLQQHKEVLRAYIRELEIASSLSGGHQPTLRGLLEKQQGPAVPPKEPINRRLDSPRAVRNKSHSFSSTDAMAESMALISTRDLVAADSLQSSMATLHLQPAVSNLARSPQRCLSPGEVSAPVAFPSDARASNGMSLSPLGTSPATTQPAPSNASIPRQRLAPDRYGQEIAMDAQWTKIKRSLVSPEVLQRAGVRYEARPDFVAVLGCLSRVQIAEFAELSSRCRAARSGGYTGESGLRDRSETKSSRREHDDDDDDDDDESDLWDDGDSTDCDYHDDETTERTGKNYPYIVSPPSNKDKASPASTVMPKPILKNKNSNHVRFDPEPHEVEASRRHSSSSHREAEYTTPRRDHRDRDRHSSGNRRRHDADDEHRRPRRDPHQGTRPVVAVSDDKSPCSGVDKASSGSTILPMETAAMVLPSVIFKLITDQSIGIRQRRSLRRSKTR